jgi:hypothetical protein
VPIALDIIFRTFEDQLSHYVEEIAELKGFFFAKNSNNVYQCIIDCIQDAEALICLNDQS